MNANRKLVEDWYRALASADLALFRAVHSPDVVYNISGHSPISGQVRGWQTLTQNVLPLVFGALDMSRFKFCKKWKIVCADEQRIVGIMEADGPGTNGVRYDQRYVHMFAFENGMIATVWEFFDTALANAVMFPDPRQKVPGVDSGGFDF
jgi:ketosteroid isomerase-like protein